MEEASKERLKEIESLLDSLEQEKKKLLEERNEIYSTESNIINSLSTRTRNALIFSGIKNDIELISYLDGDLSFMDRSMHNYYMNKIIYNRTTNKKDRLRLIRNIGEKSIKEILTAVENQ